MPYVPSFSRVGQPGVEGKERHLDRECQEEGAEQKQLSGRSERNDTGLQLRLHILEIECAGQVEEPEDRYEHQNRSEHCVQNEFHGRVNAPFVAPHADDEIHRDEHHFPENEEEEQVERNEDADHARLEHEQGEEESFDMFLDRLPGAKDCQRRQKRRQQNQEQADTVHAHVVVNRLSDPVVNLLELVTCFGGVEPPHQEQRHQELRH
jgi:hypothetical protein